MEPPTQHLRAWLAGLALFGTLIACSPESEPVLFPASCRLPSPVGRIDASELPEELVVDPQTEIRSVETIDGVLVVAMNVPLSVDEAHAAYLKVLQPPRYELINEENEGFEMEAYARRRSGGLVAVQARNPGCPEAVSIYVQLGEVPSPVGKEAN